MIGSNSELLYWYSDESWYFFDDDTGQYQLTDSAPERAIKSFEAMNEYYKENM